MGLINLAEFLAAPFNLFVGTVRGGKDVFEELCQPLADEIPVRSDRMCGTSKGTQHAVGRLGDVAQRIEQRSVEVEENGGNSHGYVLERRFHDSWKLIQLVTRLCHTY